MKKLFQKIIIPVVAMLLMVGPAQGATKLFPYQGGIGQDSSSWTGFPYITAGVWGTTTLTGLYDVLGQATSTLTSHTTTYNHTNYNTAYSWGNHAGLYDILGQATSTLGTHTTAYNHALFLTSETDPLRPWTFSGSNVYLTTSTSNVGIGTASPSSLLSISDTDASPVLTITNLSDTTTYDPAINFRTGATPAIRQMIYLDDSDSDKLKIASTTTGLYPALTIGTDGYLLSQIPDNSATALEVKELTNSYLTFDTTDTLEKIVIGKNLETGTLEIDADSGMVNFVNMNISTTTATSTAESLSIAIDGNAIITAYAEAGGETNGYALNRRVGINTTTTPTAVLSIKGNASTSGALLRISTSSTEAMYIDDAGKVGIGTTTPLYELDVVGTIKATTIRQTDTWHIYGGFQQSTTSITCAEDVWSKVTNATNDLWVFPEAVDFTTSSDNIVITNSGDYYGTLTLSVSGANGDDYFIRMYNASTTAQVGSYIGATMTGTTNYTPISLPIYIEDNVAGNHYQIQIENISNNNDPVVRSAVLYLNYLHE